MLHPASLLLPAAPPVSGIPLIDIQAGRLPNFLASRATAFLKPVAAYHHSLGFIVTRAPTNHRSRHKALAFRDALQHLGLNGEGGTLHQKRIRQLSRC